MAKVFISYSSRNQELALCFIEFLQLGMGIRKSDIFCTVFPDSLTTGENFIERIRTEIESCEVVISLITGEYLQSTFCIAEMGIAWGMRKRYLSRSPSSRKWYLCHPHDLQCPGHRASIC